MYRMMPILPLTQEPAAPVRPDNTAHKEPTHKRRHSSFLVLTEDAAPLIAQERRQSAFLVLAPVTSETYPTHHSRRSTTSSTTSGANFASANILPTEAAALKQTRSTSMSSTSSDGKLKTFLRLAPVHFGEEEDDECAVEE